MCVRVCGTYPRPIVRRLPAQKVAPHQRPYTHTYTASNQITSTQVAKRSHDTTRSQPQPHTCTHARTHTHLPRSRRPRQRRPSVPSGSARPACPPPRSPSCPLCVYACVCACVCGGVLACLCARACPPLTPFEPSPSLRTRMHASMSIHTYISCVCMYICM
jgi:hypothetical protein